MTVYRRSVRLQHEVERYVHDVGEIDSVLETYKIRAVALRQQALPDHLHERAQFRLHFGNFLLKQTKENARCNQTEI